MLTGVAAVAAILLFITAHEAGHFFAAKATGMKVTEFFIGFGPRIWSFKRGDTEYGIKPIPLGAYVKVVGMSSLEEVDPADHGRTYREKPFWAKSLVVLSGVAANFLLAFLLFIGLALASGKPVVRDGELVPSTTASAIVPDVDGKPTAAAQAGLLAGDTITAVDGTPTPDWQTLSDTLAALPGKEITLTVQRGGETLQVTTLLGSRVDTATGETKGFLGVAPSTLMEPVGVIESVGIAGRAVWNGIGMTFDFFGRVFRIDTIGQLIGGLGGKEVPQDVRPVSVVGIYQIGTQAQQFGVLNFLGMLAFVNVILGTVNVVPLFPLDGGHFAVAVYEKLTGKTADMRKLIPVAVAVVMLIGFVGLLSIALDILNPIKV